MVCGFWGFDRFRFLGLFFVAYRAQCLELQSIGELGPIERRDAVACQSFMSARG